MRTVKNLVYDYILDEIFTNQERTNIPENIISIEEFEALPDLQATLDTLIQPIINRSPRVPVTRVEVTKDPFMILTILRYILEYYENLDLSEQSQQPRLFSLFPNPSLKWRFIKIDGNNLNVLFPDTRLPRLDNETRYNGKQCAIEEACNILINGGKKYNPTKRKKTKKNRRKRKKMHNRRNLGIAHQPVEIRYYLFFATRLH